MTLADLILSNGWLSKTPAEIMALLSVPSVERRDDSLYTWAGVALVIGPQNAEGLRLALEANGLGWAVHQLGGSGIQLSQPLVQQMLTQFAAAGVAGCAELAAVGISHVTPWQAAGLPQMPSMTEVELTLNKQHMLDDAANRLMVFREKVTVWDGANPAPVL